MVSTELLQDLCNFSSPAGEAISLYFYAGRPTEPSHREEPALLKEKITELYGSRKGTSPQNREDLERLLQIVSQMKGNHRLTKVIFACSAEGVWHEINLPIGLRTSLVAGTRFRLMPLVSATEKVHRCCVALADRRRLRLFLLVGDAIREPALADTETLVRPEPREPGVKKYFYSLRPMGDDKKQREREGETKRHFQFANQEILRFMDRHHCDSLLVGCRSETRSGLEAELVESLTRRLIGYFEVDPGLASAEQVRMEAQLLLATHEDHEDQRLVAMARDGAGREKLGAVGIPAVCDALEKRETWRLLVSPTFATAQNHFQPASLCSSCDHLSLDEMESCEICGKTVEIYPWAQEAILRKALAQDVAVRQIENLPEEVAAILRFRAEARSA